MSDINKIDVVKSMRKTQFIRLVLDSLKRNANRPPTALLGALYDGINSLLQTVPISASDVAKGVIRNLFSEVFNRIRDYSGKPYVSGSIPQRLKPLIDAMYEDLEFKEQGKTPGPTYFVGKEVKLIIKGNITPYINKLLKEIFDDTNLDEASKIQNFNNKMDILRKELFNLQKEKEKLIKDKKLNDDKMMLDSKNHIENFEFDDLDLEEWRKQNDKKKGYEKKKESELKEIKESKKELKEQKDLLKEQKYDDDLEAFFDMVSMEDPNSEFIQVINLARNNEKGKIYEAIKDLYYSLKAAGGEVTLNAIMQTKEGRLLIGLKNTIMSTIDYTNMDIDATPEEQSKITLQLINNVGNLIWDVIKYIKPTTTGPYYGIPKIIAKGAATGAAGVVSYITSGLIRDLYKLLYKMSTIEAEINKLENDDDDDKIELRPGEETKDEIIERLKSELEIANKNLNEKYNDISELVKQYNANLKDSQTNADEEEIKKLTGETNQTKTINDLIDEITRLKTEGATENKKEIESLKKQLEKQIYENKETVSLLNNTEEELMKKDAKINEIKIKQIEEERKRLTDEAVSLTEYLNNLDEPTQVTKPNEDNNDGVKNINTDIKVEPPTIPTNIYNPTGPSKGGKFQAEPYNVTTTEGDTNLNPPNPVTSVSGTLTPIISPPPLPNNMGQSNYENNYANLQTTNFRDASSVSSDFYGSIPRGDQNYGMPIKRQLDTELINMKRKHINEIFD